MTQPRPSLANAILSEGGQSLPDLWRILHSNTDLWVRFAAINGAKDEGSTLRTVAQAEEALRKELMSVEAIAWQALCAAAGWTLRAPDSVHY
ncbi:hypothetical protein [Rhodovulum sulfidophilum]|uniref:hypothetical protein n=1 Tax=Rhodovulum sulfidophilum TaxID=35806 RepID=UPI001920F033|nr:hypothetical protein [Rhodovulum sulfidophilum]MBL3561513.1 hypothetical protein [Rhodovulum sulfidophilum]